MANHVDDVLALAAMEIAPRLLLNGWDAFANSPETPEDTIAYYERTGKIGVSNFFGNRRLFGSPEHCQAFDAWHDLRHIIVKGTYDLAGEMKVNEVQQGDLLEWWRTSRVPVTTAKHLIDAGEVHVGQAQ